MKIFKRNFLVFACITSGYVLGTLISIAFFTTIGVVLGQVVIGLPILGVIFGIVFGIVGLVFGLAVLGTIGSIIGLFVYTKIRKLKPKRVSKLP